MSKRFMTVGVVAPIVLFLSLSLRRQMGNLLPQSQWFDEMQTAATMS